MDDNAPPSLTYFNVYFPVGARIRRHSLVRGGVPLGLGFEVSKIHTRFIPPLLLPPLPLLPVS